MMREGFGTIHPELLPHKQVLTELLRRCLGRRDALQVPAWNVNNTARAKMKERGDLIVMRSYECIDDEAVEKISIMCHLSRERRVFMLLCGADSVSVASGGRRFESHWDGPNAG